jgi:hypothetical protein
MPKGLQTLRLAFQDTHLTHFGGKVLLQRFCNKLGLRRGLQRSIRLVLPHDYHYQKGFTNALKTIDRLRLP